MVSGDWVQLRTYIEGLVDTWLADTTDPIVRVLMDRDRERIVDFVEAAMLRKLGLASDGQWPQ